MNSNSSNECFVKKLHLKMKNDGATEPKVQALTPTLGRG